MGLLMKNKLEIDVGCDSKIWTSVIAKSGQVFFLGTGGPWTQEA